MDTVMKPARTSRRRWAARSPKVKPSGKNARFLIGEFERFLGHSMSPIPSTKHPKRRCTAKNKRNSFDRKSARNLLPDMSRIPWFAEMPAVRCKAVRLQQARHARLSLVHLFRRPSHFLKDLHGVSIQLDCRSGPFVCCDGGAAESSPFRLFASAKNASRIRWSSARPYSICFLVIDPAHTTLLLRIQ
jgi:hypothetical protein